MMTVKELIEELQKYPADSQVLGTWEGIFRKVNIYLAPNGVLVIDVDDNFYKEKILSGEKIPD